jgi:hypothetical protein
MEEACADGKLELVKESFASLVVSTDKSIQLTYRLMPGALEVLRRSACIAARNGNTTIFSFLLDQGVPINATIAAAALAGNSTEIFQALLDHGWDPRAAGVNPSSVKFSSQRGRANFETEAY